MFGWLGRDRGARSEKAALLARIDETHRDLASLLARSNEGDPAIERLAAALARLDARVDELEWARQGGPAIERLDNAVRRLDAKVDALDAKQGGPAADRLDAAVQHLAGKLDELAWSRHGGPAVDRMGDALSRLDARIDGLSRAGGPAIEQVADTVNRLAVKLDELDWSRQGGPALDRLGEAVGRLDARLSRMAVPKNAEATIGLLADTAMLVEKKVEYLTAWLEARNQAAERLHGEVVELVGKIYDTLGHTSEGNRDAADLLEEVRSRVAKLQEGATLLARDVGRTARLVADHFGPDGSNPGDPPAPHAARNRATPQT